MCYKLKMSSLLVTGALRLPVQITKRCVVPESSRAGLALGSLIPRYSSIFFFWICMLVSAVFSSILEEVASLVQFFHC